MMTTVSAKAGIQTINEAQTKWDNTSNAALSASRRLFDKLDSRLRGNDDVAGFATIAPAPSVVFIYVKLNNGLSGLIQNRRPLSRSQS